MSLSPLVAVADIHERLQAIFPEGTANRNYVTREIAAKTVFVMLYIGAVEGAECWLRPDQVTRMTDAQAALATDQDREAWLAESMRPAAGYIEGRWYAANTREPIRDETLREGLVRMGAVKERQGLPTTSPLPPLCTGCRVRTAVRFRLDGGGSASGDRGMAGDESFQKRAGTGGDHAPRRCCARGKGAGDVPERGNPGLELPKGRHLRFKANYRYGTPATFRIAWQVVNSGQEADDEGDLRGDFRYESSGSAVHWEKTAYRGVHWVEAFLVNLRTNGCVARSGRLFVLIE